MSILSIIALLIVVVVVYHFLPEKMRAPERADPKPRHVVTSESDPNWRAKFHVNIESPAEIAFIDAMVDGFGLMPRHGALFSDALRLDLQVEEGHYRADFMINRWLVVEIDGAAWHSSDEAKANDARRDAYFESFGYTVLRIAAKTALYQPRDAISAVRTALSKGRRPVPETVAPASRSGFQRLAETGSLMAKALSEVAEHSSRLREVQRALEPARSAFAFEKVMIEQAIDAAERKARIEAYLDTAEKRKRFEEHHANLEHELTKLTPSADEQSFLITIRTFPLRVTASGLYAEEIKVGFSKLRSKRSQFIETTKIKLANDASLRDLVFQYLSDRGCMLLAVEVLG